MMEPRIEKGSPSGGEGSSSVLEVIQRIDERVRSGEAEEFRPISTGFKELDLGLGGGLRLGQLVLLSGPAGVGKTSLALQIARNIASAGLARALFVCYEHEPDYLAQRLISMESLEDSDTGQSDGLRLRDIADLVGRHMDAARGQASFVDAVRSDPRGARALRAIAKYGHNIRLMKGSSYSTNIRVLSDAIRQVQTSAQGTGPVVMFVDYLQKIAALTPHTVESSRTLEELEGLKELTMQLDVAIFAIVAAESEGLRAQRMRLQHLLSNASMAYEPDAVMVMNEKYNIVDRLHVEFNRYNAEQFRQYVVLSIEKNRMGADQIDLEFRKQLQFCRFRSEDRRVQERLIYGRQRE